jgi:hypothetical protein
MQIAAEALPHGPGIRLGGRRQRSPWQTTSSRTPSAPPSSAPRTALFIGHFHPDRPIHALPKWLRASSGRRSCKTKTPRRRLCSWRPWPGEALRRLLAGSHSPGLRINRRALIRILLQHMLEQHPALLLEKLGRVFLRQSAIQQLLDPHPHRGPTDHLIPTGITGGSPGSRGDSDDLPGSLDSHKFASSSNRGWDVLVPVRCRGVSPRAYHHAVQSSASASACFSTSAIASSQSGSGVSP